MGIFSRNKTNKGVSEAVNYAGIDDARMLLTSLVSGYDNDFNVNSKAKILHAYRTIPALNTIINRSAKAFIRANKVLQNTKSEEIITEGNLYETLENPHLLQSKNEFWEAVYINYQLFGTLYVLKEDLIGFGIDSLLCLPSAETKAVLVNKPNIVNPKSYNDLIKYYLVNYSDGTNLKIEQSDSVWNLRMVALSVKNDGYLSNESPCKPIEKDLRLLNIIAEVKEELIGNHGAKGIISPDGKDATGVIPLLPKEKKKLAKEYFQTHGLTKGKDKLVISNKSVKFTAISLKMAELLLNEMQEKAELTVSNNFTFPPILLKDSTKYENKDAGNKELYENKIIPESKTILDSFNADLKLKDQNLKYVFDYSDVSFLQTDKKQLAERNQINSKIILNLNKAVSTNEISRESAIYTLVFQGTTQDDAQQLISK